MRKFTNWILAAAVIFSSWTAVRVETVTAKADRIDYNYYPMNCGGSTPYEADYVRDDGGFSSQGCYADYNSAKQKMYSLGDDGVVRHAASYSPTKIIAMTSGVAYSYPFRSGANTAIINQYSYSYTNMKTTYVTYHRELAYFGTDSYDGNGDGQVHVNLTGFDGYIELYLVDLVPMKYVTNQITIMLGGNNNYYSEDPFSTHIYQGYYTVTQNGNYLDLVYHCFSGWSNNTWPAEWKFAVGPAASWMSAGSVYYSYNGYDFYSDRKYSSKVGTYYNYYQFLPLRTKSAVQAGTYNSFLSSRGYGSGSKLWDTGSTFISAQNTYGVNALLVFSMACLESAYGTSNYAVNRNNLFGWSAYDSNPDSASYFSSITQAINEHMGINLRGYLNINDYRYFGGQLGNKGSGINVKYAGDPYWGMKIASIAYSIDKADNGDDGTLTDANSASLGVINQYGVNILKTAGGSALYNSAYGATYQVNHIVSILAESGDWYEIQSTNILSGGEVMSTSGVGLTGYDWGTNVGWLPKSQVDRVNSTIAVSKGDTPTGDPVQTLNSVAYSGKSLALSGYAYRPGIYVNDANTVTQKLSIQDEKFTEKAYYALKSTVSSNDNVTWSTDAVDLSKLGEGTYLFQVSTEYSTYSANNNQYYVKAAVTLPEDQSFGGYTYHFESSDSTANGLLELVITKVNCGSNASYDSTADACVCSSGYDNWTSGSGCALKTEDVANSTFMQAINADSWSTDGKSIHIDGTAFLTLMNAKADAADITHTLYLVNMDTDEETEIKAETRNADAAIDFGDGYDYTRINYSADIDISSLAPGNYYLKIKVTNGANSVTKVLCSSLSSTDLADRADDAGQVYRFYGSSMSNYRMELSIETSGINRSLISKPGRKASVFGYNTMTLDNAMLNIDGYGIIYNTVINASVNPVYNVILVNEATGAAVNEKADVKACPADLSTLIGSDVSEACFTLAASIKDLPAGSYRLYLDAATSQYHDIFEMNDTLKREIPSVTLDNRVYTLKATAVRSRFVLTIIDKQ